MNALGKAVLGGLLDLMSLQGIQGNILDIDPFPADFVKEAFPGAIILDFI